jgi:hypothetical protein
MMASQPALMKSADVILIPKQLRMEWTDAMALDSNVTPIAFRVGCVIGSHINRRSGEAYPRQDTIARAAGCSERTVWTAISLLESLGYLIVKRREFAPRKTDGRKVAGGRGVANTYLPAFERSQLAATSSGRKLAERCDLVWTIRSQKKSRKVAPGCDPTLTVPTGQNLVAGSRHSLGCLGDRLLKLLGQAVFTSWFSNVSIKEGNDQEVVLVADSEFRRKWLANNYSQAILECWRADRPKVERVTVELRSANSGTA